MYNGQMKRYTVAEARARFSDLLDAAEQGDPAVIERRGVRFVLRPEPVGQRRSARRRSLIEAVDPSVLDGNWTWAWRSGGLRFVSRRPRK